jgi:hypothetical protein
MTAVQLNLPGTCRRDKKARPPKRLEGALQQQARATLANLGYSSLEAGVVRKKVPHECPQCRHRWQDYPKGWQGNSVGLPDVLALRYGSDFPGVAVLIEMKGQDTPIRPAQQALADAGRSVICHSIGDAVRAVLGAEVAMDAYRLDPRRRERIERFLEENEGHLW